MTTPTYRTLAETIAQFALAEGYVQAAIDGGWDPWRYRLLDGDLEYLRGRHDDSPAGLPLDRGPEDGIAASEIGPRQEVLEHQVEGEVQRILAAAVEAAQAAD